MTARDERFDGHTIADVDSPAPRRAIADLVDSPGGSCPSTTGYAARRVPAYCSASLPQIPQASIRSRALSASISGSASSRQLEAAWRRLHDGSRRGAACRSA
jgi:hypothetical protein